MERFARRRDRGIGVADDGKLAYESLHGRPNFGRAWFDSGRRNGERQRQSDKYAHETAGPNRGQLHGLRRLRGADIRTGLHENEEAEGDGQARSTVVREPAGIHVVQAFFITERRQSGEYLSEFYQ